MRLHDRMRLTRPDTPGWTAGRAEQTNQTRCKNDLTDHAAFPGAPVAVETCGCMGKEVLRFVYLMGGSHLRKQVQGCLGVLGDAVGVSAEGKG